MKTRILAFSKKILICALAFALCLTFVGCNEGNDESTPSSSRPVVSGNSVFDGNPNTSKTESDASSDDTSTETNSSSKPTTSSSKPTTSSSKPTTSSSKPTTSSSKPTTSSSSPDTSSNTSSTPEVKLLTISCWGDSLTEGMSVDSTRNYPAVLNNYVGRDKYKVLNGGDGGEDTITIMARQGGVKIYTSNQIKFAKGESEVKIGDGKGNGFETAEGEVIRLTAPLGREMSVNDITIASKKYKIVLKNFNWTDRSCEVYLQRTSNINKAVTISKGTEAKFASAELAKTNHCDIYLMGANGGYGDKSDYNALIAQHKKMIEYRGNDNYLVVIPYWTSREFTQPFIDAFGDKAVDFRAVAIDQKVLELELFITLTPTDKGFIGASKQQVPPCLRLNNSQTDVHLNEKGYQLLAKTLYNRGKELGYWD